MTNYWHTIDGGKLKISEMGSMQIKSCIKLLEQIMPDHEEDKNLNGGIVIGSKKHRNKIKEFERELNRRQHARV